MYDVVRSLTLIRSTLPRRSLVLSDDRRASTCGAWNQSPSRVVAAAAVGAVPTSPVGSVVIWATFCCAYWPRKVTVWLPLPTCCELLACVTRMSAGPMLLSATSAAVVCAAVAFHGIASRRLAVERDRERAAVAFCTRRTWVSFVFMSL